MKIHIYIDESGSIHKNSHTQHFVIGGYMAYGDNLVYAKIKNRYKKINKKHKNNRGMDLFKELKTRDMYLSEKIELISRIQEIEGFFGCAILFEKTKMRKQIENSNIFFNYGVKLLFTDCILPILPPDESYEFVLSIDNRNTSVGDLKDIEKYLNTEFCYYDYTFKVTYYDSANHYGIQLADLIANTMYMRSKSRKSVEPVLEKMDESKFRLSTFPGNGLIGRQCVIDINSSEDKGK